MKSPSLIAAFVVAASTLAGADEIMLTNGSKIVGSVSKKDAQKVTVEVGAGTIVLDAKDVSAINLTKTALNEYDERLKEIHGSTKPGDYYDLLLWAKSKGLTRYIAPLAEKVLALDPEHAGAHAELRH